MALQVNSILGRVGKSVHKTLECTLGGDLVVLANPLPDKDIPMKRKYKIVITGSRWEGTEKYLIVPTWPNGDVDIDNVETWNSYAYAADARDIYQRKENESNVC